jgi:hypothetical protein
MKKSTEALFDTSKKVGLEVNTEKFKYMFMSCHYSAGQKNTRQLINPLELL